MGYTGKNSGMEDHHRKGKTSGRRVSMLSVWNKIVREVDRFVHALIPAVRASALWIARKSREVSSICKKILQNVATIRFTVRALCISISAILICGIALSIHPALQLMKTKKITLSDDMLSVQILTRSGTVAELLTEYDITLGEGDVVYPTLSTQISGGDEILIRRAITVHVTADGETHQISLLNGTVGKALYLAGIEVDSDDIVQPGLLESVYSGMDIVVKRVIITEESEKQRIPYHITYQDDDSLYIGKEEMVKQGSEGVKEVTYRVVTVDGEEMERTVSSEVVLEAAQNRIVAQGTRPTPTPTPKATPKPTATPKKTSTTKITPTKTSKTTATAKSKTTPDPNKKQASDVTDNTITVDGKTYTYTKTLSVMITAYTHTGRKTSTGVWPKVGTVAVDKSIIPYGTKLYIPGYGFGVAQDTGVSGYHIDVFLDTESECVKFGRKRDRTIYILED